MKLDLRNYCLEGDEKTKSLIEALADTKASFVRALEILDTVDPEQYIQFGHNTIQASSLKENLTTKPVDPLTVLYAYLLIRQAIKGIINTSSTPNTEPFSFDEDLVP